MAVVDEQFASTTFGVTGIERNLEAGIQDPAVELSFGIMASGGTLPDGTPETTFSKRTRLAPSTAIAVGKSLIEEGEKLAAAASIALAQRMDEAEQEGRSLAALTEHHPV